MRGFTGLAASVGGRCAGFVQLETGESGMLGAAARLGGAEGRSRSPAAADEGAFQNGDQTWRRCFCWFLHLAAPCGRARRPRISHSTMAARDEQFV